MNNCGLNPLSAILLNQMDGGSPTPPPAAPVATAATNVTDVSFSANWDASVGATRYYLDVATDAGFTSYVPGFQNLDVGNVTTEPVTGLTQNITYYYRVRAYNIDGTSSNSNTITRTTFTTLAQDYFDYVVADGDATMTLTQKDNVNTNIFLPLIAGSYDDHLDATPAVSSQYKYTETQACRSFLGNNKIIPVNGPVWTYGVGYAFSDNTQYIRSAFAPSAGVKYTQNDAGVYGEMTNCDTTVAGTVFGSYTTPPLVESYLLNNGGGGQAYYTMNSTLDTFDAVALTYSVFSVKRLDASTIERDLDGSVATKASVSAAPTTEEIFIGGLNNNGGGMVSPIGAGHTFKWMAFGDNSMDKDALAAILG